MLLQMRHFILLLLLCLGISMKAESNPEPIRQLLNRIGGKGADELIETELLQEAARSVDGTIAVYNTTMPEEAEYFVIGKRNGKPCIKGNTLIAISTGINWYLNHYAHINLSWNNPKVELAKLRDKATGRQLLPIPTTEERHSANVPYRYYLNYCTFSYSMATWTWERWEQEIDWMALHGINMPLQIVGLDVVWQRLLEEDYGYTREEVNSFIAGPAFQAWWAMNNLEGWGGPNPDWWYKRQSALSTSILRRERELGMQPVLPGFSGMVPSNFQQKTGIRAVSQGKWCGFQRPFILDPTTDQYKEVAQRYYRQLDRLMGQSLYYSMDPFHEGGQLLGANGKPTTDSRRYMAGYKAVFDAMEHNCGKSAKWVIQQWQWASYQATSLRAVPEGRLVVLDLFSDGQPAFLKYKGYAPQEAVYCAIPNFGGRTGFFGRLPRMAHDYHQFRRQYATIKGIGAAPEAIEQTPVVYDLLFELPWQDAEPDMEAWICEYVKARYGTADEHATRAWQLLLESALDNKTSLQGPHEAVMCARPSLQVKAVSTWGGTDIFYDEEKLVQAIRELLRSGIPTTHPNLSYDLCDLCRQALSDLSKRLLADIKMAHDEGDKKLFESRKATFLQVILDTDRLLGTNSHFRLGRWTEQARAIADEATPFLPAQRIKAQQDADRDWLELQNARTLITTWGDLVQAEGGLRDYSYRQWQGMLRDYYYPRWKHFFDNDMRSNLSNWFYGEWEWAHNLSVDYSKAIKTTKHKPRHYTSSPKGNTAKMARHIIKKYFSKR